MCICHIEVLIVLFHFELAPVGEAAAVRAAALALIEAPAACGRLAPAYESASAIQQAPVQAGEPSCATAASQTASSYPPCQSSAQSASA